MEREEQFNDIFGQAGWHLYQLWLRTLKRMVPPRQTYVRSKYFNAFYRFAQFVKRQSIPDSHIYVKLMVRLDIQPTLWSTDSSYSTYIQHMDLRVDAKIQAKITVNTIMDIVEAADTTPDQFLSILTPPELFHLIQTRRLSPWILLNSPKFRDYIRSLSSDQQNILLVLVNPKFWKKRFNESPKNVDLMKIYVKELGL